MKQRPQLRELIIGEDYLHLREEGDSKFFDLEVGVPTSKKSCKEYCVTYQHKNNRPIFDEGSWKLDHINKWKDSSVRHPPLENGGCIPSDLEEVKKELSPTGYSLKDIFIYLLNRESERYGLSSRKK